VSHHLGDRVSALADGHLDHDGRDRALAHLARCDACRREVEEERRARAVLADLPAPVLPERLLDSLLAFGSPAGTAAQWSPETGRDSLGPPAPPRTGGGGDRTAAVAAVAADRRPGGGRPADRADSRRPDRVGAPSGRHRGRRIRAAAAGLVAATAVTVGVASMGLPDGGSAPVAVVPPVEQFAVEHVRSTGSLPFVESAALLVPVDDRTGQR
jgi:anti-sigma factor RsiW